MKSDLLWKHCVGDEEVAVVLTTTVGANHRGFRFGDNDRVTFVSKTTTVWLSFRRQPWKRLGSEQIIELSRLIQFD